MAKEIRREEIATLARGEREATPDELAALDELGYFVVRALLGGEQVARMSAEFERLAAEDPPAGKEELGTRRTVADNENPVFEVCWRHRIVLTAAARILGERFEVGRVGLRDPNPGHGEQRLHPDHGPTPLPGLTATWFLDAFTAGNGATRLLPGSHHLDRSPADSGSDQPITAPVVAVGPAGSLLLRDARLYHGGGRNSCLARRRSALVFFQHEIS